MKNRFSDKRNQKVIKRPTSKDVANLAGVSRATVSAYINGTRYVSPELSKKIQNAINRLNYTPNELARSLKMQDTKTIGLIIPVLSHFYTPMLNSINKIAQEQDYSFLLCSSEEDPKREKKMLEIFLSKQISGILVVPSSEENRKFMNQIKENGTPIVQVNRKIVGLETDLVVSKNFNAIYTAAEYLLKKGRKKIALLGYDPNSFGEHEKKEGYEAAIKDYKVDNYIITIKGHDPLKILESLNNFFISNENIDGLICTTQTCTTVALQFLKDRLIKIPQDISFIGYDDTKLSTLYDPPLTVISENTYEMGQKAAMILLDRIERKNIGDTKSIFLDVNFIIRESC
ncbi:MAG: LacI family transcriptional regulator [Actinobacteria bacterium]|nr:LacI family transcriptional regulator [Actinomycetota bacterium]